MAISGEGRFGRFSATKARAQHLIRRSFSRVAVRPISSTTCPGIARFCNPHLMGPFHLGADYFWQRAFFSSFCTPLSIRTRVCLCHVQKRRQDTRQSRQVHALNSTLAQVAPKLSMDAAGLGASVIAGWSLDSIAWSRSISPSMAPSWLRMCGLWYSLDDRTSDASRRFIAQLWSKSPNRKL